MAQKIQSVITAQVEKQHIGCWLYEFTGKAWESFLEIGMSDVSRALYTHHLKRLMKHFRVATPDGLFYDTAGKPHTDDYMRDQIIGLMKEVSKTTKSTAAQRAIYDAAKMFYEKGNGKALAWGYMAARIEKKPKRVKRAPTQDELRRMIKAATIMQKAQVGAFKDTGMRKGAMPGLKLKHYKLITEALPDEPQYAELRGYRGRLIVIYDGFDERYFSFFTPEVTQWIDESLAYRVHAGEKLTPESPLFRQRFYAGNAKSVANAHSVTTVSLSTNLIRLEQNAGVRERTKVAEGERTGSIRHPFKAIHGFRMFANSTMRDNDPKVDVEEREMMLGHHPANLQGNYYDPNTPKAVATALREFLKVVPALTLFDSSKLEAENAVLQAENKTLASKVQRLDEIEKMLQALKAA